MAESMDNISLDALRVQDNRAWTELMEQLRLLAAKACNSISDDSILDEVVQESSIALAIKLQSPSFTLTAKLSTMMYSIARNQFLKQIKKRGLKAEVEPNELTAIEESKDEILEYESRMEKVESAFGELGEKCRKILRMFYFEKKRMEQIASDLNYANAQTVKNLKGRCFKELKTAVVG